jgi:hypothetical protein
VIFNMRLEKVDVLCAVVEGVAGGGGKWERISVRKVDSDFPAVVTKTSTSKVTFLRSVENETNIILLFDIYFHKSKSAGV